MDPSVVPQPSDFFVPDSMPPPPGVTVAERAFRERSADSDTLSGGNMVSS